MRYLIIALLLLTACAGEVDKETVPIVSEPTVAEQKVTETERYQPKIIEQAPPCCGHPYWQKVYRAVSNDGITWTMENKLLLEHASVPDIIKKDNKYILYYVNGEIDNFDCSVSDDGINFEYADCKIYGFTEDRAWDPDVVKLDDGTFRLYFFAPKERGQYVLKNNRILSAISTDGITWRQEQGIRFVHDGILDPAVIKINDKWMMYTWYGADEPPEKAKIVIAESNDGLTFTKVKEIGLGGGIPEVIKLKNGKYAIYFCSEGIQVMTSDDGLTFSNRKTAVNPANVLACDPTIVKEDDKYIMYYKRQDIR